MSFSSFSIIIAVLIISFSYSTVSAQSSVDTTLSPSTTTSATSNLSQSQNVSPQEIYNGMNIETKKFINRIDQLPAFFSFTKNLKKGNSVSPDVQNLKWILNSDARTALTDNPNMALTDLTSAYGPLTEAAVKKFQIVYRSEILDPQGIKNATGIVGMGTIKKLNWLLAQSRVFYSFANSTSTNNLDNFNYTNNNTNATSYNNNFVNFSYAGTSGSMPTFTDYGTSSDYTSSAYITGQTSTSSPSSNTAGTVSSSNSSSGIIGMVAILGGAALLNSGTAVAAGAVGGSVAAGGNVAAEGAAKTASQAVISQFGGRITLNTPCPCSGNYMINLLDLVLKMPISVIFQPGVSTLKMNFNPTIGQNIMGGYVRGPAVCLIYVGVACSPSPTGRPIGVIDTLRGAGTSPSPITK